MRTKILLVLAASTLGGCIWTKFDDLSDEAWVNSTEKPNVKSNDYGLALQRGRATSTTEGRLVVLGSGQPTVSELIYTPGGDSSLGGMVFELNSTFGVGSLGDHAILLAHPTSDNVALILNSGGNSILVLEGPATSLTMHQLTNTSNMVDAATYMQPPNRMDNGQPQMISPLVASGELVAGTFLGGAPQTGQPTCKLTDGGVAIGPRALGTFRNGTTDDVVAWGANGKLYRYAPDVFNGCATMQDARAVPAPADTGYAPVRGSQILPITGNLVLLQGNKNSDAEGTLQIYDVSTLTRIGPAVSVANLRNAAILTVAGPPVARYVIAGCPGATVDGKTRAGEVRLYRITDAGLQNTPVATLHDAQPEGDQVFGRAVAAMPFRGQQVIAVGANNEVFVYFRANLADGTALYGETRDR